MGVKWVGNGGGGVTSLTITTGGAAADGEPGGVKCVGSGGGGGSSCANTWPETANSEINAADKTKSLVFMEIPSLAREYGPSYLTT